MNSAVDVPCEHPLCVACLDSGCACWESAGKPRTPGVAAATELAVRAWPQVRKHLAVVVVVELGKLADGRKDEIARAIEKQASEFKLALCGVFDEVLSAGVP